MSKSMSNLRYKIIKSLKRKEVLAYYTTLATLIRVRVSSLPSLFSAVVLHRLSLYLALKLRDEYREMTFYILNLSPHRNQ